MPDVQYFLILFEKAMIREEFTFLELTRRNVRLRRSGEQEPSRERKKKTELVPFLVVFRTLREAFLTFLHNDTVLHSKNTIAS